tara:strand:+ start:632 stop:1102 length:471 start_codon:yes stop_codon:yes gene_type:complete
MVMNKNKQTNKGNTMIKEKAIDIELSEIIRKFESMEFDKIGESFAIKTFKNGKVKFEYKEERKIYFYIKKELHSHDNGYDLVIDFHVNFLPSKCVRVLKDIEDYEIHGFENQSSKKLYHTNLYSFFDDIIDLGDYIDLDNLNAADAYKAEKSIISV